MNFDLDRPLSRLQGILLSALVCVVAFLIALISVSSKSVALESAVRLSTTSSGDVQVEDEYIYYLEAGSLHCVSHSGKFIWNTGVDRSSNFKVSSNGVAVWRGTRMQILDIKNGVVVGNVSASNDIIYGIVGDVYAAVVVGPEHSSTVLLTDLYGNVIDTLTDFDGVTVLDCGFFHGRELFWIMTLDSSGSIPTCKISTYKPGRRETGSISNMEQVIYKVMFRSSNICAIGTRNLNVYDYTGSEKVSERKTVYGWHLEAVDTVSENPLMLFAANTQVGDVAAIKDIRCIKGQSEMYLHFPVACTCLAAYDSTIYGFSGSYLAVGSFGVKTSHIYRMPVNVDDVLGITRERYAVVTSGSSVYVIELPEYTDK